MGSPSPTYVNGRGTPSLQDLLVLLFEFVVVATVVVGYASMIYMFSIFCGSDSELGFESLSFTSTTNEFFEQNSSMLFHGILWKSHQFLVSFFIFPLPFFSCVLDWLSGDYWLGPSLPCFGCCGFADPNSHLLWCLNFLLDFDNILIDNSQ
jgi:hypothetical protein